MSERPRVGILISGRGSNMVSLVEAMRDGRVEADPAVVISNVPDVAGLERARAMGVTTSVVDQRRVRPRSVHEAAVADALTSHGVDVVCLAGYMRLLKGALLERYRGRILNIHPSLLPSFPGLEAQAQAIEYGVRVSGCTVHLVDELCDHGPILVQRAVPVLVDDDATSLSARILEQEHHAYPEALAAFVRGRLSIEGRRVLFAE